MAYSARDIQSLSKRSGMSNRAVYRRQESGNFIRVKGLDNELCKVFITTSRKYVDAMRTSACKTNQGSKNTASYLVKQSRRIV